MTKEILLSTELRLLVYSAFICIVMWLPYVLKGILHHGLVRMVSYPAPSYDELPQWTRRLYRAHMNLLENLAPFAVLVIVVHLTGSANETTAMGARLFFWSRIIQIAGHTAGIPWVRTLAFFAGWAGMVMIFVQILY